MNTDDYEGHTPGPWKLVNGDPYDDEAYWLNIVSEHGNGFGFVIQECVGFSDGEPGPNIKLMVAAPDLLAEVERLREALDKAEKIRLEASADFRYVVVMQKKMLDKAEKIQSEASATASAAFHGTANHLVALGEVLEILKEGE